jgi:DNA adenine methylase
MNSHPESRPTPERPALRYHGGKWNLAPWLIGFFPRHRVYVEPFGGGMSVLLRKDRCYAEVYNELDDEIVNVFRCARDYGPSLAEALRLTPFARNEFMAAYAKKATPLDRARATIIKSFMGFGSNSIHRLSGFRANSNRSGTTPAHDWANYAEVFPLLVERLRGVVIENRDAREVIAAQDSPVTLFYVDPPYPMSTRGPDIDYRHELTDDDHRALAKKLRDLEGMVVLSGYPCDLYDRELFADWQRHERAHLADGARPRTEVVWLNPACADALERGRAQRRLIA